MTSTWGNWGNYAVYGQSYKHSNSLIDMDYTLKEHSLSWGSTSKTSIPDTLSGSLTAFREAIAEVRASLDAVGTETTLSDGPLYASQVQTILNNAKGTVGPYYQYGTLIFNVYTEHSVSGGHTNHAQTTDRNDKNSAPNNRSVHSNTTGASWTRDTSAFRNVALAKTNNPISSYSTPSGKAMKSQANAILAILNGAKAVENTMPSFGSRSVTARNVYQYDSNHGNHNSHSN